MLRTGEVRVLFDKRINAMVRLRMAVTAVLKFPLKASFGPRTIKTDSRRGENRDHWLF